MNFIQDRTQSYIILFAICIIAFGLRIWGIGFWPNHLNEPRVVEVALAYGAGSLKPISYIYPPFYSYVVFVVYGFYYIIGHLLGIFGSVKDFAISFFLERSTFYILARITTVVFSALTVFITYLMGFSVRGVRTGLIAALLLAFLPLHIEISHYAVPDVPMAFFVTISILCAYKIFKTCQTKYFILAGFFAGIASAAKYPAVLVAILVPISYILYIHPRYTRQNLSQVIIPILLSFLSFCVGFLPFILIGPKIFWQDAGFVIFHVSARDYQANFWARMFKYLQLIASQRGLSISIGVVSVMGMALVLWRHVKGELIFLSFAIFYLLVMSLANPMIHFLIPILPCLCIFASIFIEAFCEKMNSMLRYSTKLITGATVTLLLIPTLYQVIKFDYTRSQPDTRVLAAKWIEENISENTRIVLDAYVDCSGSFIYQNEQSLIERWQRSSTNREQRIKTSGINQPRSKYKEYILEAIRKYPGKKYYTERINHIFEKMPSEAASESYGAILGEADFSPPSLSDYRARGFEYVVTTNMRYDKFVPKLWRERYSSYYKFYEDLKNCELVQEFRPAPWKNPGVIVRIYRI